MTKLREHAVTPRGLERLAAGLRKEDIRELQLVGPGTTLENLQISTAQSDLATSLLYDDRTPVMAWGMSDIGDGGATMWFVGTEWIKRKPHTFTRYSMDLIDQAFSHYEDLDYLANLTLADLNHNRSWLRFINAKLGTPFVLPSGHRVQIATLTREAFYDVG